MKNIQYIKYDESDPVANMQEIVWKINEIIEAIDEIQEVIGNMIKSE